MWLKINGFDKIPIRKSTSIKRINLVIKGDGQIRISAPMHTSLETIESFVISKREWIEKHIEKIGTLEIGKQLFADGQRIEEIDASLKIINRDIQQAKAQILDETILILLPLADSSTNPEVQRFIEKVILLKFKQKAEPIILSRLKELASSHGLSYREASVSTAKTRWGVCNTDNDIRLSVYLLKLPKNLMDYVILHELAHTVHKNHQKSYWDFLEKFCGGNAKTWDKQLNQYRTGLL